MIQDSGYPWAALAFAPLWAFRSGLMLHGTVLTLLFASCAALTLAVPDGGVVGVALALWLGALTAHDATDWLTSLYEKRGYVRTGDIAANSAGDALRAYREPKRPTVLLDSTSSGQPDLSLADTPSRTVL